jgi:hypothetical protein
MLYHLKGYNHIRADESVCIDDILNALLNHLDAALTARPRHFGGGFDADHAFKSFCLSRHGAESAKARTDF